MERKYYKSSAFIEIKAQKNSGLFIIEEGDIFLEKFQGSFFFGYLPGGKRIKLTPLVSAEWKPCRYCGRASSEGSKVEFVLAEECQNGDGYNLDSKQIGIGGCECCYTCKKTTGKIRWIEKTSRNRIAGCYEKDEEGHWLLRER